MQLDIVKLPGKVTGPIGQQRRVKQQGNAASDVGHRATWHGQRGKQLPTVELSTVSSAVRPAVMLLSGLSVVRQCRTVKQC
eukprot:gene24539-biopygen13457